MVIHWGQLYLWDTDAKIVAPEYAVLTNQKQASLKEVVDLLNGFTTKGYEYIALLWMLGAWYKPWFSKNWMNYPILFASWETGTGKSELMYIIFSLFGYSRRPIIKENGVLLEPRLKMLETTTRQPLQMALADYAPIFLDELSNRIDSKISWVIKAVFNEGLSGKWVGSAKNANYMLMAPVAVAGEESFTQESAVNRSIMMVYSGLKHPGTDVPVERNPGYPFYESREKLQQLNLMQEVVNYADWLDKELFENIPDIWTQHARLKENYAIIIWLNRLFQIVPEEQLLEIIRPMVKTQEWILKSVDKKRQLLHKIVMANKRFNTVGFLIEPTEDWKETVKIVLYVWEAVDVNREVVYIKTLKQMVYDDDPYADMLTIDFGKLLREKDKNKEWIIKTIIQFFRSIRDAGWQNWLEQYLYPSVTEDEFL